MHATRTAAKHFSINGQTVVSRDLHLCVFDVIDGAPLFMTTELLPDGRRQLVLCLPPEGNPILRVPALRVREGLVPEYKDAAHSLCFLIPS